MSSPFTQRAAQIGAPLGIRFNGESITVTFDDASTLPIKAIVEIDEAPAPMDGPVDVTGMIRVLTTVVTKKLAPRGTVMSAAIRGFDWHVFHTGEDQGGLTPFQIRRKFNEADRPNMYDMNDQQAVWHEP